MKDVLGQLASLRRPPLLIRTARIGQAYYRRDLHLPKLLGDAEALSPAPLLMQLMDIEADLNAQRQHNDAGYSIARHLDVLVAMLAEAQSLRAAQAPDLT